MKRLLAVMAATGLIAATAGAAATLDVDIGTAHVFRGATLVDDLVVQPAVELNGFGMAEEYGEIAVGVWGSTAPFNDDTPSLDSIYQTQWYLNYALPKFTEDLDLYIQFMQYQYSAGTSVDEKEFSFGAAYDLGGFVLGASAYFMTDDRNTNTENQKYFDFFADYALEINEKSDVSFGALIGLMFQGDGNSTLGLDDGFNQFELDAAYTYALGEMWSLGASLAYIGQLDSNVLPDDVYDKGLVAFFSVGCDM
jgi:hypothetical protein